MSTATVNGRTVSNLQVTIPAYGLGSGTVTLTDDAGLDGSLAVTVGTLATIATAVRGGSFMGSTSGMFVAGQGGWRRPVLAKGYNSGSGLQFAQLAGDAAREVGEIIGPTAAAVGSVGNFYARRAGPASQVMQLLPAGIGWWVDSLGVTQFGVRPTGLVTSPFEVVDYDPAFAKLTVMMDDTGALVPGLTMASPLIGSQVINCVSWVVGDAKMLGEVYFG